MFQISYGKKYILRISAVARTSFCKFSFSNYDFGYCVIQKEDSKVYSTLLKLDNYDNKPLM